MGRKVYTKRRLLHGWGVNDADYVVQPTINGKQVWCPFYTVWMSMVSRCHSKKFQEKFPAYIGCVITSDWKYFMGFRAWMLTQNWENKQLDKDIFGNKLYSPDTCCFVEPALNTLFNAQENIRGKWPIGVCKRGKKFHASLGINGKKVHIGYFNTPQEAHQAYRLAKIKHIENLISDYPDQRIKEAVLMKATKLLLK